MIIRNSSIGIRESFTGYSGRNEKDRFRPSIQTTPKPCSVLYNGSYLPTPSPTLGREGCKDLAGAPSRHSLRMRINEMKPTD